MMSYIRGALEGNVSPKVYSFLKAEGFSEDTNPFRGGKCMQYVTSSESYRVWVNVHLDYIHVESEFDCGGSVRQRTFDFDKEDWQSFRSQYFEAVEFARDCL